MKTHDVAQAALSLPLQSHEGDTTRVHAQCLWHSQSCFYGVSPVGFEEYPEALSRAQAGRTYTGRGRTGAV